MDQITDEFMKQMLLKTKEYCLVILKIGPNRFEEGAEKIIWEHGRKNFVLREEGQLSIVCPISSEGDIRGIGIFNTTSEETIKIMDEDPGVKAGVFIYEILQCRSFPGDSLP
jgi:hypothetical protein